MLRLNNVIGLLVLGTCFYHTADAQPFNPTVTIEPSPLPVLPNPTAPTGPAPSIWNWHYQSNETPNIVQDYLASGLKRTVWGIASLPKMFSDYAVSQDVVLNAHANHIVVANLMPARNIYLTTTQDPPVPKPNEWQMVDSARMTVMHNGRVGIGTTDPQAFVEIGHELLMQPYGATMLQITGPANKHLGMHFSSYGFYISNRNLGNIIDFNWEADTRDSLNQVIEQGKGSFLSLSNRVGHDISAPSADAVVISEHRGVLFATNEVERMVLRPNGNVGIGTDVNNRAIEPVSKLEVRSNGSGANATSSALNVVDANGASLLFVRDDGKVGVNVSNTTTWEPGEYSLTVEGMIGARELIVTLADGSIAWPDYVFEDGYVLPSISSVAHFIDSVGHLPGIPSREVVERDGINVGAMQAKLLEKIEHLTLYVIAQQKRIDALEAHIGSPAAVSNK